MFRMCIRIVLFIPSLFLCSCGASWARPEIEEWVRQREQTPHVIFKVREAVSGCDISGAEVRFVGIDSVFTSWRGECRVYGHMGHNWRVVVACKRFASIDTTIILRDVVADTITLQMVRTSEDSSLAEPVNCAYRSGWENAERSIATSDAYIYRRGGLPSDFLRIDEETGLPLRGNYTCIVDDFIGEYSKGHNERISSWIAQRGLPVYSKRPWISIVVDPKKYYESERHLGKISEIMCDSAGVFSKDRAYEVKIVSASAGEGAKYAYIRVRDARGGEPKSERIFDDKKIRLVKIAWGPPESNLVIVHTKSNFFVFDLIHCEELNLDWD